RRVSRKDECRAGLVRHDGGGRRVLRVLLQQPVSGSDLRHRPLDRAVARADRRRPRHGVRPGGRRLHPHPARRGADRAHPEARHRCARREGDLLWPHPGGDHLCAAERRVAVAGAAAGRRGARAMTPLLVVDAVSKRFRGLLAVDRVSLEVAPGEILAVIGPNGAGKTTLFNMIAGVLAPDDGTIRFDGERIDGMTPDAVCRRGIGRTFQLVRPFPALSVEDNVVIGALLRHHDVAAARRHACAVLERLDLLEKRAQPAAVLTLPDRKRLEVARALATDPKLLLLDEVMAGLRPTETDRMVAILTALN